MSTQADITLAAFNVSQTTNTLLTQINTLINTIVDQNSINNIKRLDPRIIAAINQDRLQIQNLLSDIQTIGGASAV